jgi:hypothetical protein
MNLVEPLYNILKIVSFIIYILVIFGFGRKSEQMLEIVDDLFMTLIAFVLIYFFNPLKKTICTDFHRNVAFSAGFAILIQLSIFRYFEPVTTIKTIAAKANL